jgi:hypothetical protein
LVLNVTVYTVEKDVFDRMAQAVDGVFHCFNSRGFYREDQPSKDCLCLDLREYALRFLKTTLESRFPNWRDFWYSLPSTEIVFFIMLLC